MRWTATGAGVAIHMDGAQVAGPHEGAGIVYIADGAEDLPAQIIPGKGRCVPSLIQATPPDVVSGWVRVHVAGALAEAPNWDGVICAQDGVVTHWLHISAEEIVSCQSFVTRQLADAMTGAARLSDEAMADTLSRPERLAAHLRTAQVTQDYAAVTGHLVGAELAAARPYWLGQQVMVIAEQPWADIYMQALSAQGCPVQVMASDTSLTKGLGVLADRLGLTS